MPDKTTRNLMSLLTSAVKSVWKDQRGSSMAEYALLLSFLALGTIGAVTAFEKEILALFSTPLIP